MIVLMLMQTRSSAYRSRIHIIADMRPHSFPAIKGALVIKPFLEANSFPALVGHVTSHSVSRSLCDLHVQTASLCPLVWTVVECQSTAQLPLGPACPSKSVYIDERWHSRTTINIVFMVVYMLRLLVYIMHAWVLPLWLPPEVSTHNSDYRTAARSYSAPEYDARYRPIARESKQWRYCQFFRDSDIFSAQGTM
jgi:hypothetical protein